MKPPTTRASRPAESRSTAGAYLDRFYVVSGAQRLWRGAWRLYRRAQRRAGIDVSFGTAGGGRYRYLTPRRTPAVDAAIDAFRTRPRISIVTPVFDVAPRYLEALVASVEAQWYPEWQLVLLDDASSDAATLAYLRGLGRPRIKVVLESVNRGISGATNAAIGHAIGDYVLFLDHDDELTPDCLFEIVRTINATGADYIYSDEDKIDSEGRPSQPFFKPDWSPDALMSIMYTCHISCVRRDLLEKAGPLRSEFDGAQDYDLILRVTELANRIAHIPKVLYHWRVIATSVAGGFAAKPYAVEASRRARAEALSRRGLGGIVEPVPELPGQFRVNYIPARRETVSVIIPTRDNVRLLERCVTSIREVTDYPEVELVILDNGSTSPAAIAGLARLGAASDVTLLRRPEPFNYSRLNNAGATAAKGRYLLFLNDDTEVLQPDWLDRMVGFAQLDHVGAVGAKLLFPKSRLVQHCGIINLNDGPSHAFYRTEPDRPADFGRNILEFNWLAVTGACLMIEREKFGRVGGFDEDFPIAYNDVELCIRLVRAGLFNTVCQAVTLRHHESASRGSDDLDPAKAARLREERRRLYRRHPAFFMRDPFHSPNLHPNDVTMSVPGVPDPPVLPAQAA